MIRIALASTFPVSPPVQGGQVRIYGLYSHLPDDYQTDIFSFTVNAADTKKQMIAANIHETTVQASALHSRWAWRLHKRVRVPLTDVTMPWLSRFSTEYHKELTGRDDYDVLVANHPYLVYELLRVKTNQLFIYESLNVEYLLKKDMYPDGFWARRMLKLVYKTERDACRASGLIVCASEEDKQGLMDLYDVEEGKIHVIPNGVDCRLIRMRQPEDIIRARQALKAERPYAVMVGSAHPPNVEAARHVLSIAEQMPEMDFYLVGSLCAELTHVPAQPNVIMSGIVNEIQKRRIYDGASVALNPMVVGSGTNLKTAEYFAAGVPCVMTPVGARGYDIVDGLQGRICELDDFVEAIRSLLADEKSRLTIAEAARSYVEQNFDWRVLAARYADLIDKFYRKA